MVVTPPNDVTLQGGWKIHRFSADSRLIFVDTKTQTIAINCATGQFAWRAERPTCARISPDGRFFVQEKDKGVNVIPRDAAQGAIALLSPQAEEPYVALAGAVGAYVHRKGLEHSRPPGWLRRWFTIGEEQVKPVRRPGSTAELYGYDGTRRARFSADVQYTLAESPDGDLVAFAEPTASFFDPHPVAVWQVAPPHLLWRFADGQDRTLAFTGVPTRVICGVQVARWSSRVETYDETFTIHDAFTGALVKKLKLSSQER